eukprot:TRINITY_DN162_c0_g1_i1.p1 TRINITY_DN162_c0_g1~~TRINITY_DN162_c0_g1_i1.p1  ORF type:complete len:365 (+),score=118.44 TRINITY_DN162_c0_g1_i1:135-1097(+)
MLMNRADWRKHKQHQKDLKRTELGRQRALREKLQQEINKNKLLIHTGSDKELDGYQPMHIVFVFDKSGSVDKDGFKEMKTFANSLTEVTSKFNGKYYYSLVQFAEKAHVSLECGDAKAMKQTIVNTTMHDSNTGPGSTNSAAALEIIKNQVLLNGKQKSPFMKQIVLFITDGASNRPDYTIEEAEKLHLMFPYPSTIVWAIGVGKNVNKDELKAISSKIENKSILQTSRDFAGLNKLIPQLQRQLKRMDVQYEPEKETTTIVERSSFKIGGFKLYSNEKNNQLLRRVEHFLQQKQTLESQVQELRKHEEKEKVPTAWPLV